MDYIAALQEIFACPTKTACKK